jgi:hypothetical protein
MSQGRRQQRAEGRRADQVGAGRRQASHTVLIVSQPERELELWVIGNDGN